MKLFDVYKIFDESKTIKQFCDNVDQFVDEALLERGFLDSTVLSSSAIHVAGENVKSIKRIYKGTQGVIFGKEGRPY